MHYLGQRTYKNSTLFLNLFIRSFWLDEASNIQMKPPNIFGSVFLAYVAIVLFVVVSVKGLTCYHCEAHEGEKSNCFTGKNPLEFHVISCPPTPEGHKAFCSVRAIRPKTQSEKQYPRGFGRSCTSKDDKDEYKCKEIGPEGRIECFCDDSNNCNNFDLLDTPIWKEAVEAHEGTGGGEEKSKYEGESSEERSGKSLVAPLIFRPSPTWSRPPPPRPTYGGRMGKSRWQGLGGLQPPPRPSPPTGTSWKGRESGNRYIEHRSKQEPTTSSEDRSGKSPWVFRREHYSRWGSGYPPPPPPPTPTRYYPPTGTSWKGRESGNRYIEHRSKQEPTASSEERSGKSPWVFRREHYSRWGSGYPPPPPPPPTVYRPSPPVGTGWKERRGGYGRYD